MQPCELAQARNAARHTSVTRCEVSTLPPTTAARSLGARNEPVGITNAMGAKHPSLSGISWFTRHRTQYMTAAEVTAGGAFQLPYTSGLVPVKSNVAEPFFASSVRVKETLEPSSMKSSAVSRTRSRDSDDASLSFVSARSPRAVSLSMSRTASSAFCCTNRMYACTVSKPCSSMSSSSNAMPRRFAAACALRSLRLSASLREPLSSAITPSSSYTPPFTSLNALIATPSSSIEREKGGIDPGV
mmetsp:Transcript_7778/g.32471  ORF Transcript_7778/g.32471 Transcript_7778/m.32471 type:complete len:244 (-) Transcript_7778:652-1383(-)